MLNVQQKSERNCNMMRILGIKWNEFITEVAQCTGQQDIIDIARLRRTPLFSHVVPAVATACIGYAMMRLFTVWLCQQGAAITILM